MNPSTSNEALGTSLPAPASPENPPAANIGSANIAQNHTEIRSEVQAAVGQQAAPSMAAFALPVPTAPLPVLPTSSVSSTTNSSSPVIADDSDLIEKEWVQKAKEIISQTLNDPHQQSKELNIFKADYMQKRYNKTIKMSE